MKKGRSFDLISRALSSSDTQNSNNSTVENIEDTSLRHANNDNFQTEEISHENENKHIDCPQVSTSNNSIIPNEDHDLVATAVNSSSSSSSSSVSDFDSDDSVRDKNYVPPQKKNNQICVPESDSESSGQENDEPGTQTEQISENVIQLTKKGTIRKRKHYDIPLKERKQNKKDLKTNTQYCVKPGCSETCKKKCSSNISETQRETLNKQFRNYTWREQHIYIANNTFQNKPARRTQRKNSNSKKIDRGKTVTYFLSNESGEKVTVCKIFFLTTLGFKRKNDKVLRNALKYAQEQELKDMRGSHTNPKKIDNKPIIDHINSFHPTMSHYRREHAPNRKYLPSDLNVRDMYKDFCEKSGITERSPPEDCVSYDHYRRVIKDLNISFAKLGNEECETCEIYKIHNSNMEIRHRNCTECKIYEEHHRRYVLARQKYNEDKTCQMNIQGNSDTMYYSVDLEKVIMLPRLDEFKIVMFCPRLILFNESFVPLGDKKLRGMRHTFACIWHEAISGRKKDDIASCFRAFFLHYRDLKHITLWLDNCAAQNKNWTLFSYLLYLVNSSDVNYETITLKYLEVGHTYMSADEFHHQVELSLKKKKRLYDFDDFHRAVSDTHRDITVKNMAVGDFCKFEDCSSAYKLQNTIPRVYLNMMCEVTFRRGFNKLVFKTDFDGTDSELDFLRMKNIKIGIPRPVSNTQFRGVNEKRKSDIINQLLPLMPENRRAFWYNLPCNYNSVDLINEDEE